MIMEQSNAIAALAALAQENRLDVFRLLVEAGEHGLPAGQIAARLAIPNNTLSFHLERLRTAGLVSQERRGRSIVYAANYATMDMLLGYLTRNCCAGAGPACTPTKAVSRAAQRDGRGGRKRGAIGARRTIDAT